MKKLACLLCAGLLCFTACNGKKSDDAAAGNEKGSAESSAKADKAKDGLKDGQWPASIYGKYGFDPIETKGKIVFTDFEQEGPYQYRVDYHGITPEELTNWVNKLVEKGIRIHSRDKERTDGGSKSNYDIMLYAADEKQPYRMRIAYDFNRDMEFEYYLDPEQHNKAFTITEKQEGDDVHYYIYYNLGISLNPMDTERKFEGSFDSLGLKAEDLKLNDNVRMVTMSEGQMGGTMKIKFYSDHMTTKEEFEACRDLITDKLAEHGAKFAHAMSGKEMTAAEIKEAGIGSYSIEKDGKKFIMMVDNDSEFNEFGGFYGVRLMIKK